MLTTSHRAQQEARDLGHGRSQESRVSTIHRLESLGGTAAREPRREDITKSRRTSEEQPDQPIPLEDDAKNDRNVKSRRWQSRKRFHSGARREQWEPVRLGSKAGAQPRASSNTELSELEQQAQQGDGLDGTS